MSSLTLTDSVAGDYLRVALSIDGGKLRHAAVLAEALRGAFLIDFARIGKLSEEASETELDTSPTGSDSADDLLQELDQHPNRTMECWLRRGVPHIHEVIAELLADGVWTVERHGIGAMHVRYADVDADRFAQLARTLSQIVAGGQPAADSRQASLAALGAATGLTKVGSFTPVPEALFASCETLEPVVRDVVAFLQEAQKDDLAAGIADALTSGTQIGSI